MMDVDESIENLRNTGIKLWEDCFLKFIDRDRLSRQCMHYDLIMKRLFHVMLFEPLGIFIEVDTDFEDLPSIFLVSTTHITKDNIFISRNGKGGPYWDYDIKDSSLAGLEISFINFFDFDEIESRKFQYLIVLIRSFPDNQQLVGYQAIVPYAGAKFHDSRIGC